MLTGSYADEAATALSSLVGDTPMVLVPVLRAWMSAFVLGCLAPDEPFPAQVGDPRLIAARQALAGSIAKDGQNGRGPGDSVATVIAAAEAALDAGRPWRATQLLAPVVEGSGTRPPRAVLLAASAVARWGGWEEVLRLLRSEPWLDSIAGGAAHGLLAHAALAGASRARDSLALWHARRGVEAASTAEEQGLHAVLVARAFERLGASDSARLAYERAASMIPAIEDWLRLRRVALTPDTSARTAIVAGLRTAVARSHAPRVEAAARERSGDLPGALRAFSALGDHVGALRVRLAMARGPAARAAIREELRELVETSRSGSAQAAILLLDRHFHPLSAHEQLAVARGAATAGLPARAAHGFATAFGAGRGTAADRYTYATVLARLGRHDDAVGQFQQAAAAAPLAPRARYQRARSLLRMRRVSEARTELRRIVRAHGDAPAAGAALFLLADLATDEARDREARVAFLQVGRRYPASEHAPRARFRAAIIALVHDSARRAALELDTLSRLQPRTDETTAALYWAGRAWEHAGDTSTARARWRAVRNNDPLSYYAVLASRRLGMEPWSLSPGSTVIPSTSQVDSAMGRAALLERAGLAVEARREYDWLEREAAGSSERLLATAAAFRERNLGGRMIRLAAQALRHGAPRDVAVYRLLYPLLYESVILAESAANEVPKELVAALIRQESSFTPVATSVAGARGLMQIMPDVGRRTATLRGFPMWEDALLYQPDISVELGSAHLASLLARYRDTERVLAAYNAGRSRVDRWAEKPGTSDPEVFVERIPYVETRDYVRIVLRNLDFYRTLYARTDGASQRGAHVSPP